MQKANSEYHQRFWDRFFGFNRNLMNRGFKMDQFSIKQNAEIPIQNATGSILTKARVGQFANGAHASQVAVYLKDLTVGGSDQLLGQAGASLKFKSNGAFRYNGHSDILEKVDALKGLKITGQLDDNGSHTAPVQVGACYTNGALHNDLLISVDTKDPTFTDTTTYKHSDNVTFATASQGQLLKPFTTLSTQVGVLGKLDALDYGVLHSLTRGTKGITHGMTHFMAHTQNAAGNHAGSEVNFNHGTGKFDMRLGMHLHRADHVLGLQLANSGLAKMFVKFDTINGGKASLGTELNVADFARGSLSSFPVSFKVEMKY